MGKPTIMKGTVISLIYVYFHLLFSSFVLFIIIFFLGNSGIGFDREQSCISISDVTYICIFEIFRSEFTSIIEELSSISTGNQNMQIQELNKNEPRNNICVSVSKLHDKTQSYNLRLDDDLIRTPYDIFSVIRSKKSSDIQFYGETETNMFEYFIHILIDDMAYPYIEDCSSSFIDEKDPLVTRMLDKITPKLQNFIDIISQYDDETVQRKFSLIIVPRLKQSWSLLWIQFTSNKKFINVRQIDTRPKYVSEISYNLKVFTRALLKTVLSIPEKEDIVLQYSHMTPFLESEELTNDKLLISNIWTILEGYQKYGFNIDPRKVLLRPAPVQLTSDTLESIRDRASKEPSELDDDYKDEIILTNTGTHPFLENIDGDKRTKNRRRQSAIIDIQNRQQESVSMDESPAEGKHSNSDNEEYIALEQKRRRKDTVSSTGLQNNLLNRRYNEPYVTDKNLKSIRENLPYDKEKLKVLLKEFEDVYNNIQKQFYSRWSNNAPTDERLSARSFVFPMYGPTQIEYEILTSFGVIATKNLLRKLAGLNIYPNKQQMRAISNARRWINQRFRCDFSRGCVYYLRNPHVLIPSYRDIPYIILATHLHYHCCDGFDTHNRLKGGWYISRKCVDWVISRCYKCEHKKKGNKTVR